MVSRVPFLKYSFASRGKSSSGASRGKRSEEGNTGAWLDVELGKANAIIEVFIIEKVYLSYQG